MKVLNKKTNHSFEKSHSGIVDGEMLHVDTYSKFSVYKSFSDEIVLPQLWMDIQFFAEKLNSGKYKEQVSAKYFS